MKIHKTAIIDPKAKLDKQVEVGPYTTIGPNVTLGAGTKIGQACCLEGVTTIGKNCCVFTGAVIGSIPQDLKFKKGIKSFVKIGDNNIIREYVSINPGAGQGEVTTIGSNNLLMAYTHIAHNCTVGNGVIIANVGTLAGHVSIEDKAIVGGLAGIHQFVRVGRLSIIGGCSKVIQDVLPYTIYDGNPAVTRGLNIIGLNRAGVSNEVKKNLKQAFKILLKSGLSISHAIKRINDEVPSSKEISHLVEFMHLSKRGIAR